MPRQAFIGSVAQAAGVSIQAVRYYERIGLLPPARRTRSGYRIYGPETPARLNFIRRAQALGFSLDEIREILRLRFEGCSPCQCVRELLQQKLVEVERQIRKLSRFRRDLRQTLEQSAKLPRLPHTVSVICPLIENAGPSGANARPRHDAKDHNALS